jgi:hypothetical protein
MEFACKYMLTLKVTVVTMCTGFLIIKTTSNLLTEVICVFCAIVNKQPEFVYSAVAKCPS